MKRQPSDLLTPLPEIKQWTTPVTGSSVSDAFQALADYVDQLEGQVTALKTMVDRNSHYQDALIECAITIAFQCRIALHTAGKEYGRTSADIEQEALVHVKSAYQRLYAVLGHGVDGINRQPYDAMHPPKVERKPETHVP